MGKVCWWYSARFHPCVPTFYYPHASTNHENTLNHTKYAGFHVFLICFPHVLMKLRFLNILKTHRTLHASLLLTVFSRKSCTRVQHAPVK